MRSRRELSLSASLSALPKFLAAPPTGASPRPEDASGPCPDREPLRRPYFGDLHVHTVLSLDASTRQTRNRPADTYRFARGETLGIQPFDCQGRPLRSVRLTRALDFTAVTDHAELLGEWNICDTPDLAGHDSIVCRVYRRWPRVAFFWMNYTVSSARRRGFCGADGALCDDPATIGEGLAPCCAADPVRTTQERARTSPIWYRP